LKALQVIRSTVTELLGSALGIAADVGRLVIMMGQVFALAVKPPFRFGELLRQLDFLGVQSVALIVFTGAFTGMVSALQTYNGVSKFGAQAMVSATVALGLTRELGPVLTSLMIIGRTVSSMAAEIGTMRTTQQIDALRSMAINPINYLIVPRVLAMILVLPVLALFFSFSGMVGAYVMSRYSLGIDDSTFMVGIKTYLGLEDITHGLIKSLVFGLFISLIGCNEGYHAPLGARGVASATTNSVVTASVMVLILDYCMTALMFAPRT
jgi:phospholipid/cholesterol/gamma-HCH transport system permease protein